MVRCGVTESSHLVHVAVSDARGRLVGGSGDLRHPTIYRSAAKPLQAVPLVEEGVVAALGIRSEEIAVCCGSHGGEPAHLEAVRALLGRAGLGEERLRCGAEPPLRPSVERELAWSDEEPQPVRHNCSGKHAGMLALAVHKGWELEGYHRPRHPVQKRMLAEISRWTRTPVEDLTTVTDGCGIQSYQVPLATIASSMARFGVAALKGEAPASVVAAMCGHPFHVGGTARSCTDVLERARGRFFVKVGAEGVYAGGIPESGLGFGLKVADGAWRAAGVAMTKALAELGALDGNDLAALARHANPRLRNSLGQVVGEIRASSMIEAVGATPGSWSAAPKPAGRTLVG